MANLTLFFHLFNIQHTLADLEHGQVLISLRQDRNMFDVHVDIIKIFKGRYYLAMPLTEVSYVSICEAKRAKNHLLTGSGAYIYMSNDLSQ